jgi:UDP-N-acetylglucosamine 1-carboxyvinyltransferase
LTFTHTMKISELLAEMLDFPFFVYYHAPDLLSYTFNNRTEISTEKVCQLSLLTIFVLKSSISHKDKDVDKLIIRGNKKLQGEIEVSGAKNSALPIIAATILSPGKNTIKKVPDLRDVETMGKLLSCLGASFNHNNSTVDVDTESINFHEATYALVKTMRASIVVLGPLLARYGRAKVSLPGGCAIGARPVNLHLMGLEKMGANICLDKGYVIAQASKLRGASICLDTPTVTGTENLMMAATLAEGTTFIDNAAMEPEVVDLAQALISMGACIEGVGTPLIKIEGVKDLRPLNHTIIPDRIEAATFMAASAITGGNILIKNIDITHLDAVITKLSDSGVIFVKENSGVRVIAPEKLTASEIKTMPYPGFATDMQAQYMAIMCIAQGTSIIKENVFENRFMHVGELRRMGADIKTNGSTATVRGVNSLKGAPVMATDLRASASLVIAALSAQGITEVHRIYHIDRGYERIENKLSKLGADIKRTNGRSP